MKSKRFPQYLSSPFQILWFETDDLAIIAVFFVLALLLGGLFWVALFVAPYLYSMVKRLYPRGYLRHVLYFVGLINMKPYPNYFDNNFLE